MTAKLIQTEKTRRTSNILLVCSPKLSIRELAYLTDTLVYVSHTNYQVLLPAAKQDDLLVYLFSLCNSMNVNTVMWVPAKKDKPRKDIVSGLGRQDALLVDANFDKAILIGVSSRLDKLAIVLRQMDKKVHVFSDSEV